MNHITAWRDEYKRSTWKGHYSLKLLDSITVQGSLLDAGCGSGKYTLPLTMRGFDVVGIDISLRALRLTGESGRARKLDLNIMAADVLQLPFKDDSFDAVWCCNVLQHFMLKERTSALRQFKRVLKKGGILFMEVFGKDDFRYGGREVEPDTFSRESGIIYHYFEAVELEALLCGFSINIFESRKNKRFRGKAYTRHSISVIAKKQDFENH